MTQYIVVFPQSTVGPFADEEEAKEYVRTMFGHLDSEYDDMTWSIKPLESPFADNPDPDCKLTRAIHEAVELLAEYMTDKMDGETGTFDDFPEIDTVRSQLQDAVDGTWKSLVDQQEGDGHASEALDFLNHR